MNVFKTQTKVTAEVLENIEKLRKAGANPDALLNILFTLGGQPSATDLVGPPSETPVSVSKEKAVLVEPVAIPSVKASEFVGQITRLKETVSDSKRFSNVDVKEHIALCYSHMKYWIKQNYGNVKVTFTEAQLYKKFKNEALVVAATALRNSPEGDKGDTLSIPRELLVKNIHAKGYLTLDDITEVSTYGLARSFNKPEYVSKRNEYIASARGLEAERRSSWVTVDKYIVKTGGGKFLVRIPQGRNMIMSYNSAAHDTLEAAQRDRDEHLLLIRKPVPMVQRTLFS